MYLFSNLPLITWLIKIVEWWENFTEKIKNSFSNYVSDCTEGANEETLEKKQDNEKDSLDLGLARSLSEFKNYTHEIFHKFLTCTQSLSEMSSRRRDNNYQPLGPTYLLRSVRDQIQVFQEKRGILPDENNFVNLIAVIVQQSGQAMYAVFTMFLALLPVFSIFIHVLHFTIDRILELIVTKKKNELWIKGAIVAAQLIALLIVLKFVMSSIFTPIFSMQISIITKLLFLDEGSSGQPTCLDSFACFKKQSVSPFAVPSGVEEILLNPRHLKRLLMVMTVFPAFFISGYI